MLATYRERPAGSTMRAIKDGSDVLYIDPDQVLAIASDFYEDLFTAETIIVEILEAREHIWSAIYRLYAAFFTQCLHQFDMILHTGVDEFEIFTFCMRCPSHSLEDASTSADRASLHNVVQLLFEPLDAYLKEQPVEKKAQYFMTMQLTLLECFIEVPYFTRSSDIAKGRARRCLIGSVTYFSAIEIELWTGLSEAFEASSSAMRTFRQCTFALAS
ncbi:hypothetical protein L7F22_000373 [Adiantum nelumboides]|nr:hypothetical protein [Adiantum nelumboides]